MHAFGFGLAYMLSKYDALQIRDRRWADLPAALATQGHSVHEFSSQQCLAFLQVLQAGYCSVLQFDAAVGYETDVDLTLLLLVVMQRLGDHMREQVRMPLERLIDERGAAGYGSGNEEAMRRQLGFRLGQQRRHGTRQDHPHHQGRIR
jgi:hypothetical protein